MQITLNPLTAAMLAEDAAFDLLSPSPFADILGTDPFTPTAKETAAALNEDGDDLFDLLAFDPFAADAFPVVTAGEWPCCPYHGFHEAEEGVPLDYCERCERRN